MSKGHIDYHKDAFKSGEKITEVNMHDFINDASGHIQDNIEIRKPLTIKWSGNKKSGSPPYPDIPNTRIEVYPDITTVLRRYRIGRQYHYRIYIVPTDLDADEVMPFRHVHPAAPVGLGMGGYIIFAEASDLPEIGRLAHAGTMADRVQYITSSMNEEYDNQYIYMGRIVEACIKIDHTGVLMHFSGILPQGYSPDAVWYNTQYVSGAEIGYKEWEDPDDARIEQLNTFVCSFIRNIYHEDDVR